MHDTTSLKELQEKIQDLEDDLFLKKLENQALRLSNEKYQDLFENANDAIFIVDADLNYAEVNSKAVELFGYSKEEFLNMKITDVIPPEQVPKSIEEFKKLRNRGIYEKFEGKQRTKDGRWLDIEVNSSAIIRGGKIVGSRDIVRDITERKDAEQELYIYRAHLEELVEERTAEILRYARQLELEIAERKMAEQEREKLQTELQQKQKIEAIGALAGGIAHDFNNILNSILSYTELAMHSLPSESRIYSHLEKVVLSVKRAGDLVKQILTFSSRNADQDRRPMLLQPLVKEELKLTRGTLPDRIKIKMEISPDCPPIMANFIQIHQVIMNICTNSLGAMTETGGTLTVSLQEVALEDDNPVQQNNLKPGRYACLTFQDTGSGMDRQTLDRIFEPYFTTKKFGTGTGLGLATVHGIVTSHGGDCLVDSAPGRGTTFRVYFPIIDQNAAGNQQSEHSNSTGKTGSVLLIDDEQLLAEAAKIALEGYGHSVEVFTNGLKALERFMADPGRFDVVVTDQKMPGITGAELAGEILRVRADIPVVLATGFSDHLNEETAKTMGIREFVLKPLSMADLSAIISRLITPEKAA